MPKYLHYSIMISTGNLFQNLKTNLIEQKLLIKGDNMLNHSRNSLLSIVLSISMIVGMIVSTPITAFGSNDLNNHWAANTINEWKNEGLASGYPDGTFKPDKPITRAEFMSMVNKVFNFKTETDEFFYDISETDWYYSTVRTAMSIGYINGYPDNTMRANNPITREEVATIVDRILSQDIQSSQETFIDSNRFQSWSKSAIETIRSFGIMGGYPNGEFKPGSMITRAEAIKTLDNAKNSFTVISEPGLYGTEDNITEYENLVIRSTGVILSNIKVKGNITIVDTDKSIDIKFNNVDIKGSLTVNSPYVSITLGDDTRISTLRVSDSAVDSYIEMDKGSKIETLIVDGEDLEIEGEGIVGDISGTEKDSLVSSNLNPPKEQKPYSRRDDRPSLPLEDPIATMSGKLSVQGVNSNIAFVNDPFDLRIYYHAGESYDNGSVRFKIPEGLGLNGNDTLSISSGSATYRVSEVGSKVSFDSGKSEVFIKDVMFINRFYDLTLVLNERMIEHPGALNFSAYGDKDGSGRQYLPTDGTGLESDSLDIVEGKTISGIVKLPYGYLAPLGGLDVEISAGSFYDHVTIPEGLDHAEYSIHLLPGRAYEIEYRLYDNKNEYVESGFYSNDGTVSDFELLTPIEVGDEDVDEIDIDIIKGYLIKGTVVLPDSEVASEDIYVSVNARGVTSYGSSTGIERGYNSADYSIVVPDGDFIVSYSLYENKDFIDRGYYSITGTLSKREDADSISIFGKSQENIDLTLLRGNIIHGSIALPGEDTFIQDMQYSITFTDYSQQLSFNSNNYISIGEKSSSYSIRVPNGEYIVSYRIYDQTIYATRGYYHPEGTKESVNNAYVLQINNEDKGDISFVLLPLTIGLVDPPESIKVGQTVQLTARTQNPRESFSWSSTDPNIIEIAQNGMILGVGEGEATITVSNSAKTLSASAIITVLPNIPASGVYGDFIYRTVNENQWIEITGYTGASKAVVIPSEIDGKPVKSIGIAAFSGKGLTGIELPDTIVTIGLRSFDNNQLEEVVLPEGIETIGSNAFSENIIESIDLPDSLMNLGSRAFRYNLLTNVKIPESIINLEDGVFSGNNIATIEFNSTLKTIGSAAFYGNKLVNLVLPEGLIELEDQAFEGNLLESLEIPTTVTYIGDSAFARNKLVSLVIPGNVEEIDYSAFEENELISVEIGDGVRLIRNSAFRDNAIETAIIPASVISIGTGAFANNQTYPIDLTILGVVDSYAQIFAANNSYSFEELPSRSRSMFVSISSVDEYTVHFGDEIRTIKDDFGLHELETSTHSAIVFASRLFDLDLSYDSELDVINVKDIENETSWTIDNGHFYDDEGLIFVDLIHLSKLVGKELEIDLVNKEIVIK